MKPDAVEDIAIWIHPDVQVGGQDVVEGSDLLVPEESVRHPDLAGVREGQVADPLWNIASGWNWVINAFGEERAAIV